MVDWRWGIDEDDTGDFAATVYEDPGSFEGDHTAKGPATEDTWLFGRSPDELRVLRGHSRYPGPGILTEELGIVDAEDGTVQWFQTVVVKTNAAAVVDQKKWTGFTAIPFPRLNDFGLFLKAKGFFNGLWQ